MHWHKAYQITLCFFMSMLLLMLLFPFFLTVNNTILQKELLLKRLSLEKAQQDNMIANLPALQLQAQKIETDFQEKSRPYLAANHLHMAWSALEQISKEAAVNIMHMDRTDNIAAISLLGNYAQHLLFLQKLDSVPYLLLRDLQIKSDANGFLHMLLHVEILFLE
jgi:hypothetical protein